MKIILEECAQFINQSGSQGSPMAAKIFTRYRACKEEWDLRFAKIHAGKCEHASTEVVIKHTEKMSRPVRQCLACGAFAGNAKKADSPNVYALREFDEEFQKRSAKDWYEKLLPVMTQRSEELRDLWFEDYGAYLQSGDWRKIRAQALRRDDGKCVCCGLPATQVHHKTYDRIGCEDLADLASVCESCHGSAHASCPVDPDRSARNAAENAAAAARYAKATSEQRERFERTRS